jgi:hypothetical protein
MNIKTVEDWRTLAAQTMPKLPEYASNFRRVNWDADKAQAAYDAGDNRKLANMFEKLWADLPDSASIRFAPFFDLCDLCSERWVMDEAKPDDGSEDGGDWMEGDF